MRTRISLLTAALSAVLFWSCATPTNIVYFQDTQDQQALQDEFEARGVAIVQRLHKTDYHNQEFVIEDIDGRWIYFGIKE